MEIFNYDRTKEDSTFIMKKATIPEDAPVIVGETILHGFFKRNQSESNTIQFVTIQGDLIACAATEEVTLIAAQNVDTTIILEGIAEWNSETFEIVSFSVSSAAPIQNGISDAFEALSDEYGHYFEAITDVDTFIQSCRA